MARIVSPLRVLCPNDRRGHCRGGQAVFHTVAATKDDPATFPVYIWVVALKPVMSEVNVLLPKIRYGEGRYARGVLQLSLRVLRTL